MIQAGAVNKKYVLAISAGLIIALLSLQETFAQISSATADHIDTLGYLSGNPARDPLFVFYQQDGIYKPGTLTAIYPDPGNYNFDWSRYNPAINGFDPAFSSETGTTSSTVNNLDDGGYRVRIWNGSDVDVFLMSWVFLDHFRDSVAQSPEGTLPGYLYTCDIIALEGYVFPDTLEYYDLNSHELISRPLDFSFKWTSDNEDLLIPNDTIVLRPNISYAPPYQDTEYYLTATDEFGMSDEDEVFYESIQTKAEFTVEYLDKVTGEYSPDLTGEWSQDMGSLDAMLTARFLNQSLNGASFDWVYLDTTGMVEGETTYDVETITEYTYETADKYYYPYMIATSEDNCTDTFRLEGGIHVVPSQLAIPNVFSPNGDGINDYFVFKHQSLESCKVTIVDRNGKVVYKREIEDIYSWEGWDGKLHDSSREASEGQYYFVVEAMGYDGIEYRDPSIWGSNSGSSGTGGSTGGSTPGATEQTSNTLYTGWLYLYRNKGGF